MGQAAQRGGNNRRQEENEQRALVVQPPRLPMPIDEARELGVTEGTWKALVDAVYPSAKTVDGVVLALRYCRARNLDPMKRAVHVVPMWNSALNREVETVWPGINELRTTASRTKQWAGNDDTLFGTPLTRKFEDSVEREGRNGKWVDKEECTIEFPEWAQVTVYRMIDGQRQPFVGPKVRFMETFAGTRGLNVPNARWRKAPWQMLEKCAEAAALRRAFPEELANDYAAEEMEGRDYAGVTVDAEARDVTGEAGGGEQRPTRESTRKKERWEELGIRKDWWDEIEQIQRSIDSPGSTPPGLRRGKEDLVDRFKADGWDDAALDELELRFDTAIAKIEGDVAGTDTDTQTGRDDDEQKTD